jgi:RNA polymerase sigma-70 factor (ECF subfamily)
VTPFPPPNVQPQASEAESARAQTVDCSWTALCESIRDGHPEALGEFYRRFQHRRWRFFKHLGMSDSEDAFHQCYLEVVAQIKQGNIREPERMEGFIEVVARRLICQHIAARVQARRNAEETELLNHPCHASGPEEGLLAAQRHKIVRQALDSLQPRQREVLVRFYIQEQRREQIMAEMDLNETQFRLLKSRAKARFGKLGARRLAQPLLAPKRKDAISAGTFPPSRNVSVAARQMRLVAS